MIGRLQPLGVMLALGITNARFKTMLFTLFGVLGVLVAAIGVYGLMAF